MRCDAQSDVMQSGPIDCDATRCKTPQLTLAKPRKGEREETHSIKRGQAERTQGINGKHHEA
eukprot:14840406-Alexandrium_andersonii.AAC.1